MRLTKYGRREWLGAGILAAAVGGAALGLAAWLDFLPIGLWLAALTLFAWLAVAAFFRDPRRVVPDDPTLLLAPADGVVRDIETAVIDNIPEAAGISFKRVGIFLSVLDVHLNRAPCDFEVLAKVYRQGAFHDARDSRASRENESLTLFGYGIADGVRFPMAVRQISGAIARRIVCAAEVGSKLGRGEVYGMIKFGSRTELFVDAESPLAIGAALGDRLRAGESVVGKVDVA